MENLPKRVALQWAKWCRNKNYFFAEMKEVDTFFHLFQSNILSISIADDAYAPKEAVDWLTLQFTNTTITRRHITPCDYGLKSLGHFGYFKNADKGIGSEIIKFIEE